MKTTVKTYQVSRWRWVAEMTGVHKDGKLPDPLRYTFYAITRNRAIRKAEDHLRYRRRIEESTETTELSA